jgi:BirA family biotin operon repressor/biotin-[acetyl-CoA-carboxylase] ligase
VWAAEHQTEGRGRRSSTEVRKWHGGRGANLTFSILLRPELPPRSVAGITLAVAVGCAEVLRERCAVDVGLKWPNDLVVGGRKLGGILTEAVLGTTIEAVSIGIGINVNVGADEFPAEIANAATSLRIETGRRFERAELLAHIVEGVFAACDEFVRAGDLSSLKSRWSGLSVMRGRQVVFEAQGVQLHGKSLDIDDSGRLQIELESGDTRWLDSGEVLLV